MMFHEKHQMEKNSKIYNMNKYRRLIVLLLVEFSVIGDLFSQDIRSNTPVVLPQSPATSYTVTSGQTVSITSGQSVTLGPGTFLEQGSNVTIRISNSPFIPPAPSNPSEDLQINWILARDYDDNGNVISENKKFFDNTGKATETEVKNLSAQHVLASQVVYDALDRPALQTLLAPVNNSAFSYKENFVTNSSGTKYTYTNFDLMKANNPDRFGNDQQGTLGWYYSSNNNLESYIPDTGFPFSRNTFYEDGTPGVVRSSEIGDALKPGSGHESVAFICPVVNELSIYQAVRKKYFSSTEIGEYGGYLDGQATQYITRDNNGKIRIEIKDKSDRLLMSARPGNDLILDSSPYYSSGGSIHYFYLFSSGNVYLSDPNASLYDMTTGQPVNHTNGILINAGFYKAVGTSNGFEMFYGNGYTDITYYFYNQLGQMIAKITPEGAKLITEDLTDYPALSNISFVSTYEYDTQGRLIAATSPDAGRIEYIYRTDGSIRFSQNTEQRKTGRFSYTNYDQWSRPAESGEYIPGDISFATAKTNRALQENAASDGGLTGGIKQQWVKTHYDLPDNSHGVADYIQDDFFLKGGISWTENEQSKTWYNYDSEGRLSWLIKQISGLGNKTIDYTYNAQGSVSRVDYQKNTASERFIHEYEYDADGRLQAAYTLTDPNGARREQARYYYYLHGPLKRVELAQNLQGIDYTYTPQGWLKTINHPDQSKDPGHDGTANSFAPDAFGMTLEYFSGDYSRSGTGISSLTTGSSQTSYTGNIMAQSWKSMKPASVVSAYGAGVNNPAMFTYEYDDKYQFNNNKYGAPNFGSNSFTEAANQNREYGLSYDKHGNIQSLNRTNNSGSLINALTYHYQAGTNRLSSVDNYATYQYDDLGQMTAQIKGSQGMYLSYDVSGKVTAIYSDAAKTQLKVSFGYDEGGNRIQKTDHISNITTYYVSDATGNVLAIYDNNGSAFGQKEIPVYASGRIGMYNRSSNSYQYELTDHLGNVRAVINQNKTTGGLADVVYYSDYYPYGSALTLANSDYRYGYQGKYAEMDKESAWVNFALRMYDPVVGRWITTDPAGQYDSPYVGMGNNPVLRGDPDGGDDSPIFDSLTGDFLGVDSEGYNGDILFMNGSEFNALTNYGTKVLDHNIALSTSKNVLNIQNDYALYRAFDHVSKLTDNIGDIQPMLFNGNVSFSNYNYDLAKWIKFNEGSNPSYITLAETRRIGGKIRVTFNGDNKEYLSTVENVQNVFVHEFKGHGLLQFNGDNLHYGAYKTQMEHSTFNKITPILMQQVIMSANKTKSYFRKQNR